MFVCCIFKASDLIFYFYYIKRYFKKCSNLKNPFLKQVKYTLDLCLLIQRFFSSVCKSLLFIIFYVVGILFLLLNYNIYL